MTDEEKNMYWTNVKAWKVKPTLLPEFLKTLKGFSSGHSFQGIPDGKPFAIEIKVKDFEDWFIVTARTCDYPYCDFELERMLNDNPN